MQIRYALTEVTAPAKEPLTGDEAKLHLRVEDDEHDELINLQIAAARREARRSWDALSSHRPGTWISTASLCLGDRGAPSEASVS